MTTTPTPSAGRAPTHIAYADEAQYNFGRIRGLGLVSLRCEHADSLSASLAKILRVSDVSECKWEKVGSAKTRFVATKMLDWALDHATQGAVRVDVVTWDTHERPPAGRALPHIRNLQRMYAHLVGEILLCHWPPDSVWRIYPDEQDAMRWDIIEGHFPHIERIVPRPSHEEPLIQLADLFVGLGVFSRSGYDAYEQWLCYPDDESRLPTGEQHPPIQLSGSIRQRCLILDHVFTQCKLRHLGISLRTHRGLKTYDPQQPIGFWWYKP